VADEKNITQVQQLPESIKEEPIAINPDENGLN
jgi:hypothetical protein